MWGRQRTAEPSDPFTYLVVSVVGGAVLSLLASGADPFLGFAVAGIASIFAFVASIAVAVEWALRRARYEQARIDDYADELAAEEQEEFERG